MSYIDKNLLNSEHVVYRAKLHWSEFLGPIIWLVISLLFYSAGNSGVGTLIMLIGLLTGVGAAINFATSEFGITNKRILVKTGFIRRQSFEIMLQKVEGIQVSQGVMGRLLGFGSVTISGTGGSRAPFRRIAAPIEFRKNAQEEISSREEMAAA